MGWNWHYFEFDPIGRTIVLGLFENIFVSIFPDIFYT